MDPFLHEAPKALILDHVLPQDGQEAAVLRADEVDAEALLRHRAQQCRQLELDVESLLLLKYVVIHVVALEQLEHRVGGFRDLLLLSPAATLPKEHLEESWLSLGRQNEQVKPG